MRLPTPFAESDDTARLQILAPVRPGKTGVDTVPALCRSEAVNQAQ